MMVDKEITSVVICKQSKSLLLIDQTNIYVYNRDKGEVTRVIANQNICSIMLSDDMYFYAVTDNGLYLYSIEQIL